MLVNSGALICNAVKPYKNMLKILLVSNLYPNDNEPTRGVFTEQIVEKLSKGNIVEVMAPTPWFPMILNKLMSVPHKSLPVTCVRKNIKVYHPQYLVIPKFGRWLYGLLFFVGIFNTLRRIKKSFNPDVINVHWMYPDGFGTVLAAKLLKIPVVTHSLGCDINEYSKYPGRRFFIKQALKMADFNISVSDELRRKTIFLGSAPEKSISIMNGVNGDMFAPGDKNSLREKLNLPVDNKLFLYAGNFNIEKGLEVLLRAFSLVHNESPGAKLVIVGSGPLEHHINSVVSELNIADKLIFIGRVGHEQVIEYLGAADFLCLPSLREGCPNIVLESLSVGTPVLASRVGAVPEMLASNSNVLGLLAEPGNIADFSSILSKSLSMDWPDNIDFKWMDWQQSSDKIVNVLARAVLMNKTVH
jgi:teichuronic acid biosynthesis glycosyltransferase TuaC